MKVPPSSGSKAPPTKGAEEGKAPEEGRFDEVLGDKQSGGQASPPSEGADGPRPGGSLARKPRGDADSKPGGSASNQKPAPETKGGDRTSDATSSRSAGSDKKAGEAETSKKAAQAGGAETAATLKKASGETGRAAAKKAPGPESGQAGPRPKGLDKGEASDKPPRPLSRFQPLATDSGTPKLILGKGAKPRLEALPEAAAETLPKGPMGTEKASRAAKLDRSPVSEEKPTKPDGADAAAIGPAGATQAPPPKAEIAPPVAKEAPRIDPAQMRQIAQKVLSGVEVSLVRGRKEVSLGLDLGKLGGANVQLSRNDQGKVEIVFQPLALEAGNALQSQLPELTRGLEARGIEVADVRVQSFEDNVRAGEDGRGGQESRDSQPDRDRRSRGAFELEPEEDEG